MPWTEITTDDNVRLGRVKELLVATGDWYEKLGDPVTIRKLLAKGGHLYIFKNANHEMLLCFQNKGKGKWKVARYAYAGSNTRAAAKICAAKIQEFLSLKGVRQVSATVPIKHFAQDSIMKTFYTHFKSDAWEVEKTDLKSGEAWVLKDTKVRP